jgi:hypothetical protein
MTSQDSPDLHLPAGALTDGFDDDPDWEVAPPPRRRLHWSTTFLIVALIVVAAFAGGILAQKHWGGSSSGGFALPGGGNLPAGFPRATSGGAASTGGFGGGTRGTVSYVDGNVLYVSTGSGSVVSTRPEGLSVDRTVKANARRSVREPSSSRDCRANGTVKATGVTVTAGWARSTDGSHVCLGRGTRIAQSRS